MALGDKYNYTYNLNKHTAFSFYKNMEHFFKFNSIPNSESIREFLLNCFNKNAKSKTHKNIGLTIFENKIKETNNFFKINDKLMVTKADKGNTTVVIERDKYVQQLKKNYIMNYITKN